MTPVARLRTATHVALEGAALNHAQQLAIYNPTPEVDSLAERVAALRRSGVPANEIAAVFADLRTVLALNSREAGCHHKLAGELDRLTRALSEGSKLTDALTIRGLVRALRDPLSTLLSPQQATAAELVNARDVVRNLISTSPIEQLRSSTLAHELGGRRHRLLIDLAQSAVSS